MSLLADISVAAEMLGELKTAQNFVIDNPSAVGLLKEFVLGGCDSLYPARYSTILCVNVPSKNDV
ncbi:uncharacterized protein EV420DRAFT_1652596 [Desarmillaria tabescens]|uniref:Uncharacterized protein n=1 Tax=Armillaria tabescens TaxID=1929756 RepID=A0AA39MK15_ARMTA|nr:uncharacterized protein EV420DRAFT_1652596 [Desarmillaria tabescens]KAK0436295.1 hypothetical protein EV420DRAFT_1652596 [Desarmillaria tabescens]